MNVRPASLLPRQPFEELRGAIEFPIGNQHLPVLGREPQVLRIARDPLLDRFQELFATGIRR